jgi:hypothetical protein
VEEGLGENQLGFKRGKGTDGVIWMLRIISELAFDIDKGPCVCLVDWQKARDHVM